MASIELRGRHPARQEARRLTLRNTSASYTVCLTVPVALQLANLVSIARFKSDPFNPPPFACAMIAAYILSLSASISPRLDSPVVHSRNADHEVRLDDLRVFQEFGHISRGEADGRVGVHHEDFYEALLVSIVMYDGRRLASYLLMSDGSRFSRSGPTYG